MQNSVNLKTAVPSIGGLAIIVWAVILVIKGIVDPWEAAKEIPAAAGYVGTFSVIFAQWLWKLPWLQGWLVLVPNLNGTWKGELVTTWKDPQTGLVPGPIDALLVVRQTLFKTSCVLRTKESISWSRAVAIQSAPDGAMKIIEFVYSNTPKPTVQHGSKPHDGACSLEVVAKPSRKLIGRYWTDRGTTGEMKFNFSSKKHREFF